MSEHISRIQPNDLFSALPYEMQIHILQYTDNPSAFLSVNSKYRTLINDTPELYKHFSKAVSSLLGGEVTLTKPLSDGSLFSPPSLICLQKTLIVASLIFGLEHKQLYDENEKGQKIFKASFYNIFFFSKLIVERIGRFYDREKHLYPNPDVLAAIRSAKIPFKIKKAAFYRIIANDNLDTFAPLHEILLKENTSSEWIGYNEILHSIFRQDKSCKKIIAYILTKAQLGFSCLNQFSLNYDLLQLLLFWAIKHNQESINPILDYAKKLSTYQDGKNGADALTQYRYAKDRHQFNVFCLLVAKLLKIDECELKALENEYITNDDLDKILTWLILTNNSTRVLRTILLHPKFSEFITEFSLAKAYFIAEGCKKKEIAKIISKFIFKDPKAKSNFIEKISDESVILEFLNSHPAFSPCLDSVEDLLFIRDLITLLHWSVQHDKNDIVKRILALPKIKWVATPLFNISLPKIPKLTDDSPSIPNESITTVLTFLISKRLQEMSTDQITSAYLYASAHSLDDLLSALSPRVSEIASEQIGIGVELQEMRRLSIQGK